MFRKNLGGYNENMAPYAGPEALCFQVVRLSVCVRAYARAGRRHPPTGFSSISSFCVLHLRICVASLHLPHGLPISPSALASLSARIWPTTERCKQSYNGPRLQLKACSQHANWTESIRTSRPSLTHNVTIAYSVLLGCSETVTVKRCSHCDCDDRATSCNIVRFRVHDYCDVDRDATAMWLRPEISMFTFLRGCTRLQPITAQDSVWAWSTNCGVTVYCYFYVFRLINKSNWLFAVIFLFNYVDFMRYPFHNAWNRRQWIEIWQNYDVTGWLTGFVAVASQLHHSHSREQRFSARLVPNACIILLWPFALHGVGEPQFSSVRSTDRESGFYEFRNILKLANFTGF